MPRIRHTSSKTPCSTLDNAEHCPYFDPIQALQKTKTSVTAEAITDVEVIKLKSNSEPFEQDFERALRALRDLGARSKDRTRTIL